MSFLKRLPKSILAGLSVLLVLVCLIFWSQMGTQREIEVIKQRYQAFKTALSVGDETTTMAMIAPNYRDLNGFYPLKAALILAESP